jgi:predicted nicotinamide N-methyase
MPWLAEAATGGIRVLAADPGRRYLPVDRFEPIATYDVATTTQLEDRPVLPSRVFTVRVPR